jgi:hypothetical protein
MLLLKDAVGPRKPLSDGQNTPFDRPGHTVQRCSPARDRMRWYSSPLIEPMLHFSSPKRSVKLKAQSKTGSANSNPTGESRPIAIFGFVPKAFPIVVMTVERLLPPTTDSETGCCGLLRPAVHHKFSRKIDSTFVLPQFQGSNQSVESMSLRWFASTVYRPEVPISHRINSGTVASHII